MSAFAAILTLVVAGAGSAVADEDPAPEPHSHPTLQELEGARWRPIPPTEPTDPKAAEELPHDDLDRAEARELLTSVFGPAVEAAGGVYGHIDVKRYDSNYEALVQPHGGLAAPTLLESSLPLRVKDEEGRTAPVDLSLESTGRELRSANPLVEVGVPSNLGEGIALPEAELTIRLAGHGDGREASILDEGSAAFYPDVARDTDLTVVPNPLGVETMTQLRTPAAPRTQTFELELAPGQALREARDGGAEVVADGKTVMAVHAPSAIDAAGEQVPATMTTAGASLTIRVEPDKRTAYPILVDPIYDVYYWGQYGGPRPNYAGWTTFQNTGAIYPAETQGGYWGLTLNSWSGPTPVLSQARWDWHVPRWAQDRAEGRTPSSYIVNAWGGYIDFDVEAARNGGNVSTDPFMDLYLWDEAYGFVGLYRHYGTEGDINAPTASYPLPGYGDTNVKQLSLELVTTSAATQYRHLFMGYAKFEIADNDSPVLWTANPSRWVNNWPTVRLPFSIEDPGLGVYALNLGQPTTGGSGWTGFTTRYGACTGGTAAPCARAWSSAGGPAVTYDPSRMPQGEDVIQMQAVDPLGHASALGTEIVKVDHTKPALTATGTYGEQGSPAQPVYTVKYKASDGTAAAPQSGAVWLRVKVDGKLERSLAPGCAVRNCEIAGELTLPASKVGSGTHHVEVTAADGVGLAATPVTLSFALNRPDTIIDSGPAGLTSQTQPIFGFHSTQGGSTFLCRIDTAAFAPCSGPGATDKPSAPLAAGEHVFEVKAVNGAGLQDPTPAKREFTVVYPPDTTITFGPEGLTNLTRPVFGYESDDRDARFECKLDSGSFEPCGLVEYEALEEEPEAELSESSHTFSVRAVNLAGDADPTPATASVSVDAEPPTAEVTSGPTGPTGESQPTFDFSATGGTVSCLLEVEGEPESEGGGEDEGEPPFEGCTTASSYTPESSLADGAYAFRVRVEDEAQNETEGVRWFTVDTVAPETTITSAPAPTTDDAAPTFEFSSSETESSFECRFDAEAFRPCSGPGAADTPLAALGDGEHSFEVRATDAADNADPTPATDSFTLLTSGPQTSIDSGPEGAIGVTEAGFAYSADEAASFECSLDGAAFAACPEGGETYAGLSEGEHVFEVRAKNTAGIADPTPPSRAFVVDTSDPETPELSGPVLEEDGYGIRFQVEVSDGSDSSAQGKRSGVRAVQILLAGELVEELKAECENDVCPSIFVRDAQLPYKALLAAPVGSSLEAKALDGKGHSSSASEEIEEPHDHVVERSGPEEGEPQALAAPVEAASSSNPDCNETLVHLPPADYKGPRAVGTSHADLIIWRKGIKLMEGNGGCDVIIGGSRPQTIKGGSGPDIIRGRRQQRRTQRARRQRPHLWRDR